VEIDFGRGLKIRRTLTGNIAAYVCAPDGRVVDIIPGLYDPDSYLEELQEALDRYTHGPTSPAAAAPPLDAPSCDSGLDRPIQRLAGLADDPRETLRTFAEYNRAHRKPRVRGWIAGRSVRPADIDRTVFKELFGLDLDDPFLGLWDRLGDGGPYGRP
jgi:hypothetical protein